MLVTAASRDERYRDQVGETVFNNDIMVTGETGAVLSLIRDGNEYTMTVSILAQHIEITPEVAGGKPRIAGHRITVQNIVIWHERLGRTADEIVAEHKLTLAEIYSALAYYFDHRSEIDRSIKADEAFAVALRQQKSLQRTVIG